MDGDTCMRCGRSPIVLPHPRSTPPRQRKTTWTRAGVVRAIRAFAFFRGRAPVRQDWHGRMPDDWPPVDTVERLFGSVEAALSAAGPEAKPQLRAPTRAA
jgi:hypothetical protein